MAALGSVAVVLLLSTLLSVVVDGLQIARPSADCLSPASNSLSGDFWPRAYRLQSLAEPAAASVGGFSTTVEFAEDFSVTYRGTYKVVVNKRANETYVLYQCGTPNPVTLAGTETGVPSGTKVFEVPLTSVAVTDSNAAAFLVALGLVDRVARASEYSVDPCLQAVHRCTAASVSATQPQDYDLTPANDAAHAQDVASWREAVAAQDGEVDAILGGSPSANPKSIAVTAYADPGVLNRAEWVKFVALFFNKEVEADALFSSVSSSYERLNASARAAAAAAPSPVRVAWASAQGDALHLSFATYKRQLMQDAGGEILDISALEAAGGTREEGMYGALSVVFSASNTAQREAFLEALRRVDVLFDESYAPGSGSVLDIAGLREAYGLTVAEADSIPALRNAQVWTFNGRVSEPENINGSMDSGWFEGAVARPDQVLGDFVAAITPSAAPSNTQATWLRRLLTSATTSNGSGGGPTVVGPGNCSTIQSAPGAAGRCERAEPARICPNAYRDCATGELKAVSDPTERCQARTSCPAPEPAAGAARNGASTVGPTGSSSGFVALLLLLLAVALLHA